MSGQHDALCGACWAKVHFIDQPYCAMTGHPFSYDLGPGIISADAIANPPPYLTARSAVVFDDLSKRLIHRLKYHDRSDLAPLIAKWMIRAGSDLIKQADCLVPLPLHRWRLMARKYNQSAELSRAMLRHLRAAPPSDQSQVPKRGMSLTYLPHILYRRKNTRPQIGLAAKAREDNVAGAFHVPLEKREHILGQHVLLVDDVLTTGATVNAATRALLRAGAENVSVLTFARVVPELS